MSKLFQRKKTSGWETAHGWRTYLGNKPSSYGKPGGWEPGDSTITRKDVGQIDPRLLLKIPGENGEDHYLRENGDGTFQSAKYGDKWAEFVAWAGGEMAKPDTLEQPMIVKKRNGQVRIWEGNHRIRAAVQAGLPLITVEIVYWAFSEDTGLVYDPATKQFSPYGKVQPREPIAREASKKVDLSHINFRVDHVDSHSGQHDMILRAFLGQDQVGACEFRVYGDDVSVSMLSVNPSLKRNGIGRALLRRLQAEFPGQEIHLGAATHEGGQLLGAMTFQEEPSEHAALFAEQTKLKAEEAELQQIADDYYEQGKPLTPEFEKQMERFNAVSDRLWELDQLLWDKSGVKRLIASHLPRVFVDMDGVLADYCKAADAQGIAYEDFPMVPGAFRNLPLMPGAREAFLKLLVLVGPERLYILSTPAHDRYAESVQEKSDWLDEFFPEVLEDHRIFTADKGGSGQEGDILIDDHPDWNGADTFPGHVVHFKGVESWEALFDTLEAQHLRVEKVAATPVDLQELVSEFMHALGAEDIEFPTIQAVARSGKTELGWCASSFRAMEGVVSSCSSQIYIQKGVLIDEKTARRVVAHEVCHHVANWNLVVEKTNAEAQANLDADGGHGPAFLAQAQKINAVYGEGFVTVTSDQTYTFEAKQVHLFVAIHAQDERVLWAWSTSVTSKLVDKLRALRASGDTGWSCYIGITKAPPLVIPKAKNQFTEVETQAQWEALKASMALVTNEFPDYASRVKQPKSGPGRWWTLVMTDPDRGHEGQPRFVNAWKILRALTADELKNLRILATERQIRVTKVTGHADLYDALPKFTMDAILYAPGISNQRDIREQYLQDPLQTLWAETAPTSKAAAEGWDAETTRWHSRERMVGAREVQQGLRQRFQQLIHGLYVQPGGQQMTLSQFLSRNPITELFRGTDRSVRLMGNRIRTELDTFLQQHYTPKQVQDFKAEHGANVTDWLTQRIIAAKTARASDELLTKRYGATPEQIQLAKQVDQGDYLEWVVKQLTGVRSKAPNQTKEEAKARTPTIRLPEDAPKLRKYLEIFTKLKRSPKFTGEKNILNYSPADLARVTEQATAAPETLSQKEQVREMHRAATLWSGQVEHPDMGLVTVTVLKPEDAEVACEISGGPGYTPDGTPTRETGWCTVDPDTAQNYLNRGSLYVIKVNGKNYAQLHVETGQFMDVNDEEIPTLKVPGAQHKDIRFINDPVCNAAMIGADLPRGKFTPVDPRTSPPAVLVAWYAAQDAEIPDEVMARVQADPEAVALMVTQYGFEEDPQDMAIVLQSPSASRLYFQWYAAKLHFHGKLFSQGIYADSGDKANADRVQTMMQALKVVETSPMESASLIVWFFSQRQFELQVAEHEQWFQELKNAVKSDPDALLAVLRLTTNWDEMKTALMETDPDKAIQLAQTGRRSWPELEAKIVSLGDQRLAISYMHRVSPTPTNLDLVSLAFSKVPEGHEELWEAGGAIYNRIQRASRRLGSPVPYREAVKSIAPAGEDIIWATVHRDERTGLLATWTAWALQDQPEKRQQALEVIAADPNADAVIPTYLADTEYRRAKILEPHILKILETSRGNAIEAILYVAHQYAPQVKGARDAAEALKEAMQGRSVAASER